jgi:hypothetical protein
VLTHPRVVACLVALLPTATALAQPTATTVSFCDAVGGYMQEMSLSRAAGTALDTAIDEVALDFDALATDADDLANRRRVLQMDRPLAVFAYGLGDLRPETVKQVGTAHCLARDGDVRLAPSPLTTAAIAAEVLECEDAGSVEQRCIERALGAEGGTATASVERAEPTPQRAPERSSRIQPFYELGLATGGDALGSIVFVDGSQQDVDSGEGFSVGGGVLHRINDRFGVKYTASYKVSFTSASNADVVKSVLPIDIIPYYRVGNHKVGLGLSYHLSPEVDWDWLLPTTSFDDAAGLTVEYGFRWFTFSYTDIDYENGPASVDAGHFGFRFSSKF